MQFHVKFFLTKNEFTTTIKHPDMYDFKKVCAKIMFEFPRELADGTVGQSDFRDLMERHIMIWSDKAYIVKEPVRYIGLQVFFGTPFRYPILEVKKFFSRNISCLSCSLHGYLMIWNGFSTVRRGYLALMGSPREKQQR